MCEGSSRFRRRIVTPTESRKRNFLGGKKSERHKEACYAKEAGGTKRE